MRTQPKSVRVVHLQMLEKGVHNLFCVQIVQVGEQFVKGTSSSLLTHSIVERGYVRR